MNQPNFSRHLSIWPTLPIGVHFRTSSGSLPFPLDQEKCQIYSLARHAIWNACHALGLNSNDIVLVPAYHHGSEIEALLKAGLKICYYELNEQLEPDKDMLESILSTNVRALYLIHYLGFPQNAAQWRKWCDQRGLFLLEDAAQAFLATQDGKPIGSFGHMGVFCLYKTYGIPDGGAVISELPIKPPDLTVPSGVWRMFKNHYKWVAERNGAVGFFHIHLVPFLIWWKKQIAKPHQEFDIGNPSLPATNMTSRLLSRIIDQDTAQRRRENYRILLNHFSRLVPTPFATLPEGACPFGFPIEVDNARSFLLRLRRYGVLGELFWLHPHPSLPVQDFPRTLALRERLVALPVHQELTPSELQQIIDAVYKANTYQ